MSVRLLAVMAVGFAAGVHAQVQFTDALMGSTTGTQSGGSFEAGGGWRAGRQVKWDLGSAVTEGSFSVELLNWNPNSNSPQHGFDKQHIVAMYEAAHGSPHASDSDSPKTSFWQVRTGASYDNCFKFLSSTAGFAAPPAGRHETRITRPLGAIDPAQPHTLEVRWTRAGDVTVLLDGVAGVTHQHGTALRLRYVFVGTDDAPAGTYGPQADVIYRNVRVTGSATPVVVVDAGSPVPPVTPGLSRFAPTADTWSEPANPSVAHGNEVDLRTGGDGRTIFLRFDVQGVGQVSRARLVLRAMNAGGGGELHRVADASWSEATLTHLNKPVIDAAIVSSLARVEVGAEATFDVSSALTGNGVVSFAITSSDGDGSGYDSREAGASRPELVVEWSGTPGAGGGTAGGGTAGGGSAAGGSAGGGSVGAGGGSAAGGAAGGAVSAGGGASNSAGGSVEAPSAGGAANDRIQVNTGCSATVLDGSLLGLLFVLGAAARRSSPG